MITASSGLLSGIEAETRNPTAYLGVDWKMNVASGEWADIDVYDFDDESDSILSIEIYSEMVGDFDQYSTSDFDCELINTNNRFTPEENKNLLKNPGFELEEEYWSFVSSGVENIEVIDDTARTGRKYLKITNPASGSPYAFSDATPIFKTDGYHYVTNDEDTYYNLSFYVIGSGQLSIGLRAYDQSASGLNIDIDNGFITGSIEEITF